MAYKCVVFDFDGTLADTEEKTFNIYNDMAEKYKYRKITKEELQHIKNLHIKEIMEIVDIPFYKLPRVLSAEENAGNHGRHTGILSGNKNLHGRPYPDY